MTTQITFRNYRTYLLNQAIKTGDRTLANLAKMATITVLRLLFSEGYKLPKLPSNNATLDMGHRKVLLTKQSDGTVIDEAGIIYETRKSEWVSDYGALYANGQKKSNLLLARIEPSCAGAF